MSGTTAPSASAPEPLVFLHVGDLHLTAVPARSPPTRAALDLREILAQIEGIRPSTFFDFVYLPGDLAENGCPREYAILSAALALHPNLPIRLIPGDHDRQLGNMNGFHAFHAGLVASRGLKAPEVWTLGRPPVHCPPPGSPAAWPQKAIQHYCFCEDFRGVRCLFLDIVSPGFSHKGIGLDFRLGSKQTEWLNDELQKALAAGAPVAVFMHAYPDDLREPFDRLDIAGLFWASGVRIVEMGHTHYNEIASDGRTVYAAARSVGQNEDGSVGYAVAAIDGPVTSWRFKALDRKWPFVLITSPADWRVAKRPADPASTGMVRNGRNQILVRAVVLSDVPPRYVRCRVGTGPWTLMTAPVSGLRTYWVWLTWPDDGRSIQVEAVHPSWDGHDPDYVDTDEIEPVTFTAWDNTPPSFPEKPGSDTASVGAWIRKGVRGDQLGPNKLGRKW